MVAASLVLLVLILVEVVPKFASYSHAWAAMTHLDAWWWAAIAGVALVNQISGVWPYQAALPGLRFWDGFLEVETTGAIANTVPAGGAVAIGMTYKMFSSFGFSAVDISTAIIATGIWNFAAKLGLPVAAVALLAITAHPTARVLDAAVAGVVAMVVAGVALWLVFRFAAWTHWLGRLADRVVNWVLHFFGKPATDRIERSLSEFKSQTAHIVRRRGWPLTGTTLANQFVGFVLVLIIVRAVGITAGQVTLIAVFTSLHDRPAGGCDSDYARRSRDTRCRIHQPDDGVRRKFVSGLGRRSHLAVDGVRPPDHPGHRDLRHLAAPARANCPQRCSLRRGPSRTIRSLPDEQIVELGARQRAVGQGGVRDA